MFVTILEIMYKYARYIYPGAQEPRTLTFSDTEHCLEILACKSFNGERNQISRLVSRAIPNQRLVEAFGLDKAFTSEDHVYAKLFNQKAVAMIKLNASDWRAMATEAHKLIRNGMMRSDGQTVRTEVDRLIQSVTLKIAIHVLFRHDPVGLDDAVIESMASSINELWTLSKGSHDQVRKMQGPKQKLRSALSQIFPDYQPESTPRDNPLNYIIPAYETLWRAVLFCFIETNFRTSSSAKVFEWRETLRQYLDQIIHDGFEQPASQPHEWSVTVEDIVNEALRLYTPTRRIHRYYKLPSSRQPQILAADIEALHREPNIFGDDPLIFKPARWHHLAEEAHKAFLPFGSKPILCPAQKEFGPKVIAVLVAALTACIDPSEWDLEYCKDGEWKNFGGDEMLETNRGAYASWLMSRKG